MILRSLILPLVLAGWLTAAVLGDEYQVEALPEPAPADEISAEIAATLAPTGTRVLRDSSREVCDIWLCKSWEVPKFEPGRDLLYPFQPGQLIGVVRYARRGADFRDQDVGKGVYTLRYAQQPVDGAHVGTSITRDFLLLLPAESDRDPAPPDYRQLTESSAEVAGSSHPALLSLQKVEGDGGPLTIREDEEKEWWIVRLQGKAQSGQMTRDLKLDLVVIGQAAE